MRSLRHLVGLFVALSFAAAACSDDSNNSTETNANGGVGTTVQQKPTVSLPSEVPTELIVTNLVTGSGPAAEVGDDLLVDYVGVLSADGQEFDSSYDRAPIQFTLGTGGVILGWDQGLIGVQQGDRLQLDIPTELAYNQSPPNGGTGVIKAGDALSFVVDVVAVLPRSDAADAPQVDVAPSENIAVLQITELIVGDGPAPQDGQTVALQIVLYRADTGELLTSGWGGPPLTFAYSAQSNVFPGLLAAVEDMQVGGRRLAQIPFTLMFDGQGSESFGVPAQIDLVVIIDLIAVY